MVCNICMLSFVIYGECVRAYCKVVRLYYVIILKKEKKMVCIIIIYMLSKCYGMIVNYIHVNISRVLRISLVILMITLIFRKIVMCMARDYTWRSYLQYIYMTHCSHPVVGHVSWQRLLISHSLDPRPCQPTTYGACNNNGGRRHHDIRSQDIYNSTCTSSATLSDT